VKLISNAISAILGDPLSHFALCARCFTMWMAGGGSKGGTIHGETNDFSNIVKDRAHALIV
jgi:hypothetical protein